MTIEPKHTPSRLAWIDNLRTFIIFLVVSMHACVTYSYVGGWYTYYPPGPSPFEQTLFILWQAHLQAFFMGLLFFLAGVFAHQALVRRGAKGFLKERFMRLGVPSFLYMLFIQPVIVYVILKQPEGPDRPSLSGYWLDYVMSGRVLGGSGPMWFAVALFLFCCVFAIVAMSGRWSQGLSHGNRSTTKQATQTAPTPLKLLGFGLGLVICSFLVRLAYPLGSDVFNLQLGFFSQYIAVFTLGIIANRNGWFEALVASKRARVAGWIGIIVGPIFLISLVAAGGPPPQDGTIIYSGGWNPWAFGLAFWEQLTGLAIGLGIMSWFHRFGNTSHPYADWLSRRSFGVYMLHSPIMVALTPMCNPIADNNRLVAAIVLTFSSLLASYIVADLAIRIPGLRKMI